MSKRFSSKIGFLSITVVLIASLILNIYFLTQENGAATSNNEIQSQLNTLQSQLNSLDATHQEYVETHSFSNSDYNFLFPIKQKSKKGKCIRNPLEK